MSVCIGDARATVATDITGETMIAVWRAAMFSLVFVASLASSVAPSSATDYPNRPVRWLIGFTAGGPVDTVARIMAQWLSERFGQQFVVENRAGSGGNIAAAAAIPAVAETVPGFESVIFYGISAPKGTPPEIVDILNKAVGEALKDPKLVARLGDVGGIPKPMTPAEFGRLVADETEKWRKVVEFAGVSVD